MLGLIDKQITNTDPSIDQPLPRIVSTDKVEWWFCYSVNYYLFIQKNCINLALVMTLIVSFLCGKRYLKDLCLNVLICPLD